MDAISYEYTKVRKTFGIHTTFTDSAPSLESVSVHEVVEQPQQSVASTFAPQLLSTGSTTTLTLDPTAQQAKDTQWLESMSTTVELDCIPTQSAHEVNTERFVQLVKGTSHTDGAWPSEIKTNEAIDRQRYVRRILNEPSYHTSVVSLTKTVEQVIMQNNTIDLYQEYFAQSDADSYSVSPPSAKTVCVFRDPSKMKRTCTKISWHPEGANKMAVAYSVTAFQSMPADMPLMSYIWDVSNPNNPDSKLVPLSPLTTLAYNPRSPDQLVGGCYNGLLSFFDLRKGASAVENSLSEKSHHDPVYDVHWIQSRTGNECCSISTDGQLLWWDIRKLKLGYTDCMILQGENDVRYGGTSLEYKSDAGATRFLVATEQGVSILCDRKAKKDSDSQKSVKSSYGVNGGQHFGPIYSVQRNPFNLKYFLTVGDWSAKIWMEDLRSPIIQTRFDRAYLTNATWSPTRPGVYYTTKSDGTLDVWDLYHKQETPTYTLKVTDSNKGLTSIKAHNNGRLLALGDGSGTTTVVSVSRGLWEQQKDEKGVIAALLERETKREKNLEVRMLQRKRDAEKSSKKDDKKKGGDDAAAAAAATSASNEDGSDGGTAAPAAPAPASSQPITSSRSAQGGGASAMAAKSAADILNTPQNREAVRQAEEDFFALIDRAGGGGAVGEDAEDGSDATQKEAEEEKTMDDDAD